MRNLNMIANQDLNSDDSDDNKKQQQGKRSNEKKQPQPFGWVAGENRCRPNFEFARKREIHIQ